MSQQTQQTQQTKNNVEIQSSTIIRDLVFWHDEIENQHTLINNIRSYIGTNMADRS